jgi:hypothetical protein
MQTKQVPRVLGSEAQPSPDRQPQLQASTATLKMVDTRSADVAAAEIVPADYENQARKRLPNRAWAG